MLTPQEARQLFAMLRRLRTEGRLIIFITHKLREVGEIADRVTIMRRGRVVGTDPVAALTERTMAERMVGAIVADARPGTRSVTDRPPALRVAGLRARDTRGAVALDDVSFTVSPDEILGIAGVDGNGQRELFDVLVGACGPRRRQCRGRDDATDDLHARRRPSRPESATFRRTARARVWSWR